MSLKSVIFGVSRRVQFKGKGVLLDRFGLGVSNVALVPPGVNRVDCVEGITIVTSSPRDVMFRELYVHGLYQPDVLVALRNLLKPGDVFWDIGANYGFMSIFVDRVFGGRVRTVAFEPNPTVAAEFRRNIEVNASRSIQIEERCLSDRDGMAKLYVAADRSWNATLVKEFAADVAESKEIEVVTSTLDECVNSLPRPSTIKLDVEGAEHLVIEGGRTFLAGGRVPIVAEYNLDAIVDAGLTPRGYLEIFESLGYACHVMKRPLWGPYRWRDLTRVADVRRLPPLCNLVMLGAD